MGPHAVLRIDLHGDPANMAKVAEWLHKQADYLTANQTELSKHFRARLFIDETFKPKHPVTIPHKGHKVEGSAL